MESNIETSKKTKSYFAGGLDFSLNSAAYVRSNTLTREITDVFIFNNKKYGKREQQFYSSSFPFNLKIIQLPKCSHSYSNDFENILCKIENSYSIIREIASLPVDNINVEAFSFGSRSGHIDKIVSALSFVKERLIEEKLVYDYVSPLTLKKFVRVKMRPSKDYILTKVDNEYHKTYLLESFIKLYPDTTHFMNYFNQILKLKNIPSPTPDLVDGYFLSIFSRDIIKEYDEMVYAYKEKLKDSPSAPGLEETSPPVPPVE